MPHQQKEAITKSLPVATGSLAHLKSSKKSLDSRIWTNAQADSGVNEATRSQLASEGDVPLISQNNDLPVLKRRIVIALAKLTELGVKVDDNFVMAVLSKIDPATRDSELRHVVLKILKTRLRKIKRRDKMRVAMKQANDSCEQELNVKVQGQSGINEVERVSRPMSSKNFEPNKKLGYPVEWEKFYLFIEPKNYRRWLLQSEANQQDSSIFSNSAVLKNPSRDSTGICGQLILARSENNLDDWYVVHDPNIRFNINPTMLNQSTVKLV